MTTRIGVIRPPSAPPGYSSLSLRDLLEAQETAQSSQPPAPITVMRRQARLPSTSCDTRHCVSPMDNCQAYDSWAQSSPSSRPSVMLTQRMGPGSDRPSSPSRFIPMLVSETCRQTTSRGRQSSIGTKQSERRAPICKHTIETWMADCTPPSTSRVAQHPVLFGDNCPTRAFLVRPPLNPRSSTPSPRGVTASPRGRKWSFKTDVVKPRAPAFTIGERRPDESDLMCKRSNWKHYHWDENVHKPQSPSFTFGKKLPDESDMMCKRSPWTHYDWDTDVHRPKSASSTMGCKLPDESDLMRKRSPWIHYDWDTNVDRPRSPSFTFGRKLPDESDLMCKRGPWIHYDWETDVQKLKSPSYTIGKRLPDKSDLMCKRSLWTHYDWETNAHRPKSPSFTIGRRLPDESDLMCKEGNWKFYLGHD